MHYKNGREAKNGDKVILFPSYGAPVTGILYDAVAGNDTCNGRIAATSPNDPMPNLAECLHVDDVKAADAKKLITDVSSGDQSPLAAETPATPPAEGWPQGAEPAK